LSGIGNPQKLAAHNIDVVKDLPGVGENLQDHLQIRSIYKVNKPITINDEMRNPFKKLWMALEYALFRRGPLTMAASQVAIFANSNELLNSPESDDSFELINKQKLKKKESRPDIQYHLQPMSADKPADGTHSFSAFTASVCQLRPSSRGFIELRSNKATDKVAIYPNYLATNDDQQVAINAVKLTRKIVDAPALKPLIASEHEPGEECQSDEEILNYVRNRATTIYHPSGTCKMGNDSMSVVDERLRVHGVLGLRVVDCSIMPELVSGNTNAAAIMIAEKAADMIIEDNSKI